MREGWERPLVSAASFRDGRADRLTEPRFSPDGRRIMFVRVTGGVYTVWLTNVMGGTPVPLGFNGMVPVWSPDGNWIAYENLIRGQWSLGKIASGGGGKPIELTPPSTHHLTRTQWSPGGEWLTSVTDNGLALVSTEGGRMELLSGEPGWQAAAGFTRDGTEVVGIRENEKHHLTVEAIEVRSKRSRIILDMGPQAAVHGFSLAPDGKSFLTTLERAHGDIWILEGFPKP